jgi:hypothetical protein
VFLNACNMGFSMLLGAENGVFLIVLEEEL